MKLGLSIGYSGAELKLPVEKVQLAERLCFDSGGGGGVRPDEITPRRSCRR